MSGSARQRLGERVKRRRRELGLSVVEAARTADINRMTWDALERGTRAIRDHNHAGVERSLRWTPGSIETILAGGEPHDVDEVELPPDEPAGAAAAVRQIREIVDGDLAAGFTCETRLAMIRDVIDRDAPVDAAGQGDVEPARRRAAG